MTQGRSDHYVPQFILRRFRSKGTGRLFYAERDAQWISERGVSRTFCEPDGDLLLKGPPTIKQEGGFAVLAGPPEYTTGLREHLSRLEDRWARAIKRLVEAVCRQHRSHARPSVITRLERVPPKHAEWCAHGKDYCIRQMIRSPDAGNELWSGMLETEERELRAWIRTILGRELEPCDELRTLWHEHNRHKFRTGAEAEAEGLWDDVDATLLLTTYYIVDDSRFILGSRGGVWLERHGQRLWICPVDPRVALGIEGRRVNAEALGLSTVPKHHFAKSYVLPRDDLAVADINRASWDQCHAVAAFRLRDLKEVAGTRPLVRT